MLIKYELNLSDLFSLSSSISGISLIIQLFPLFEEVSLQNLL